MKEKYRIAIFAHNEETNIEKAIESIMESFGKDDDFRISVLANGCKDSTVDIVQSLQKMNNNIDLIEISLADKCNAWNTYVYEKADDAFCHFFCDGDVTFSISAFKMMMAKLKESSECYSVAGVPLSGRGRDRYLQMIKEKGSIFGNLYAVKTSFLDKVREKQFKLPIGYLVEDNLIGRIICTDIDRRNEPPKKSRVVYDPRAGYLVKSLNMFSLNDIGIYLNRLIRYRLGEMQQTKLRPLQYEHFPATMDDINLEILEDLQKDKISVYDFIKRGVIRRLKKQYRSK